MLRPDAPLVVGEKSASSMAAEQFRTLTVQLEQSLKPSGDSGFVLGVTSSEPGAGKTLTSLNLVLTMAPQGTARRLLLIECDLWNPSLRDYLDVEPELPGLYQLLSGDVSFSEAKVPLWASMVDIILAGRGGEVGNLMNDERIEEVLARARDEYEIVILDTPPFFLASGRSLSGLSDGILVLARAGETSKSSIEDLLSALDADKVLGMSLTHVSQKNLRIETAGAYSYYAYRKEDQ